MRQVWLFRSPPVKRSVSLRYSSNVPGPLEARRRSTKRRYADTALSYGEHAAIDTGLLLSLRPPYSRAQDTLRHTGLTEVSYEGTKFPVPKACLNKYFLEYTLPPWLTQVIGRPETCSPSHEKNLQRNESSIRWENGLSACKNFHEILDLPAKLGLSLGEPGHSSSAFRHLCELQPDLSTIFEFLSNRNINPPAARNLIFLATNFQHIFRLSEDCPSALWKYCRDLGTWLGQEARLGNLDEREIRSLFRWASTSGETLALTKFRATVMQGVGYGIYESIIRPIHQLQRATIRSLVRGLASTTYLSNTQLRHSLLHKIIRKRCREDHYQAISLWKFFVQCFLQKAKDDTHFNQVLRNLLSLRTVNKTMYLPPLFEAMMNWRTCTPVHRKWYSYCMAQPDLLAFVPGNAWVREAVVSEIQFCENQITSPIYSSSFVQHADAVKGCEHVLRTWVLPRVDKYLKPGMLLHGMIYTSPADIESIFERLKIRDEANPERIAYVTLIDVAHSISSTLSTELAKVLLETFNAQETVATLALILRYVQHLGIELERCAVEKAINQLAMQHTMQALSLFLNDTRLRLKQCLPLVVAIIASPSIPTETIIPLIPRHERFDGYKPKLYVTPQNIAFFHFLAAALAESNCSSSSRLALISRVLDMFGDVPMVFTESIRQSLLRSEIVRPLERGEKLGRTARLMVMRHIANWEGEGVYKKLEWLLASWESRQVIESNRREDV